MDGLHKLIIRADALNDPALLLLLGHDLTDITEGEGAAEAHLRLSPPVIFKWDAAYPCAAVLSFGGSQFRHHDDKHAMPPRELKRELGISPRAAQKESKRG